MNKLNHHLRQYRHNDSDGFVAGYEREGTEAFVSCLEEEIKALKAQVSSIKKHADGLLDSKSGIDYSGKMDGLLDIIDKTPQHCLAIVKADAVELFGHDIGLYDTEYDDQEYIEVSRYSIREHIEQLRDNAK